MTETRGAHAWLWPAAILASGAAAIIVLEALRGGDRSGASAGWLIAESAAATVALLLLWRVQSGLRLAPLLVVVGGLHLALAALHLHVGIPGDVDVREVYREQGNSLLDGSYPRSDYPPGAVVLFAVDALLGGGPTRAAHAFVMVPFTLIVVAAIWSFRTETSAWLAALFALLPGELYFWEYRFDLVPAACLALGLALALRRNVLGAAALAVGTWVKWLPALAAGGVWLWLSRARSRRAEARSFALVFTGTLVALHVPFLLWDAHDVVAAYTGQGGRGITAESLPYLPLRALGLAHLAKSGYFWDESIHPAWADVLAVCTQLALVATAAVVAARCRTGEAAVAAAGLIPAVFALTNRVFSPQFTVLIVAAWLAAGALLCRTRREQLVLGAFVMVATTANAVVYPARIQAWILASALFFAAAAIVTAALLVAAARAEAASGRGATSGRSR